MADGASDVLALTHPPNQQSQPNHPNHRNEGIEWIEWIEADQPRRARWRSEAGLAPPKRVEVVDDALDAGNALKMAREGTGLLYRGDFQNARQLLAAMA